MKLHVFNPEHDIALAHNDKYFTAPRAGRILREDCGFLPALWAEEGDFVLVNDISKAEKGLLNIPETYRKRAQNIRFITLQNLRRLPADIAVEPWGWDSALCFQLSRNGFSDKVLPDEASLNEIRALSNRRFSSIVLRELRRRIDPYGDFTVGESQYVSNVDDLFSAIESNHHSVLKEPWSSSGRGVRYVGDVIDEPTTNWIKNIINSQEGIMVEPWYDKVCDFGMEFLSDNDGVHYRGLSLFETENGFYIGNIIASEAKKERAMSQYLSTDKLDLLRSTIESLLNPYLSKMYKGPLGVDMMIVRSKEESLRLHPMVEINLRRTMGHVAIELSKEHHESTATMRIVYENKQYHMLVEPSSIQL